MKILIVDDEKLVRAGMTKILKELFPSIEIIDAKNGLEGLELIKSCQPEIVITDIRMPVMDGLELMKHISGLQNSPSIIVLSGYDEFSYAKKAILNGAKTYILKPVDRKELEQSVCDCITQIKQRDTVLVEDTLRNIFEGCHVSKEKKAILPKEEYVVICTEKVPSEFLNEVELVPGCYLLKKNQNSLTLLVTKSSISKVKDLTQKYTFTVGVSEIKKSYIDMNSAYRQSLIAFFNVFFVTINKSNFSGWIQYKSKVSLAANSAISSEITSQVLRLSLMVESSNQKDLICSINDIFKYVYEVENERSIKLFYFFELIKVNLFGRYSQIIEHETYLQIKKIMLENITEVENLSDWKSYLIDFIIYLNKFELLGSKEFPFIIDAIDYMEHHFKEPINMILVANQVSTNYTYFSETFSQYTKMNFTRYLNILRIEEAKKLLSKGCYKVYEVSNRSGFGDVKYFMKKFKEETGMSPTQYRKLFSQ